MTDRQTDRQTDERTDVQLIAITCAVLLTHVNNLLISERKKKRYATLLVRFCRYPIANFRATPLSRRGLVMEFPVAVKAGVVYLQVKLCDSHLSALEVRFSRRGAIQIYVYHYLYLSPRPSGPYAKHGYNVSMRVTV